MNNDINVELSKEKTKKRAQLSSEDAERLRRKVEEIVRRREDDERRMKLDEIGQLYGIDL